MHPNPLPVVVFDDLQWAPIRILDQEIGPSPIVGFDVPKERDAVFRQPPLCLADVGRFEAHPDRLPVERRVTFSLDSDAFTPD